MPALARFALCILVAASPAARVSATPPDDPAALAEAYFDETERFDALLTFENRRGPARMVFTLARRFRGDQAELLFDIREPTAFRKWALLARQTRGGSDDLFAYFAEATGRRVRRISAAHLERQAVFSLFAIGDFRPPAPGELGYEAAGELTVAGRRIRVVKGLPTHGALGFDRVELQFDATTGLLLESRYFRGEQEFRRISIAPDAYEVHEGRRLPMRRFARSWGDDGVTELVLRGVLATPGLPDALFSHRNLVAQRFPDF